MRRFGGEGGGSAGTWDNSEFEQLICSHRFNFSFLLHSAAFKYKVPKERGRPTGGEASARVRVCGPLLWGLRGGKAV